MALRRNATITRQLSTLFNVGTIGELTDGQLLEWFVTGRGESAELAFAALVERHGPLVLHTCRSIVHDEHKAEDAFQATFLVLVRKAGAFWTRDSLAPWLHQVAYRAARHARSASIRRKNVEKKAAEMASAQAVAEPACDDLSAVVHEEVVRLPDRYRVPVLLNYSGLPMSCIHQNGSGDHTNPKRQRGGHPPNGRVRPGSLADASG